MSKERNNNFISYNSLISLCVLSEEYDNSQYAKFLCAEENLEHSLNFKLCKKTLLDYSDIKGSLFYIRNIDECISNFGVSDRQENISKELAFLSREKIQKNTSFYLQHMTSKKFISIEKTLDNKFILKLTKNVVRAAHFYLRKVNEQRNSKHHMHLNDIFNLSVYIEDDGLFYYLKDDLKAFDENNKLYKLIIELQPTTNFYLINQQWTISESKEIYSGQLLNIIFYLTQGDEKKELMLSVIKKEKKGKDINDEEDLVDPEEKPKYDDYIVKAIPYTDELNIHVLYNSFWIFEEDNTCVDEFIKFPLEIKKQFRIRNIGTGLYLNIKEKGNNILVNDYTMSDEYSDILYEFNLVDEHFLDVNLATKFHYNFMMNNFSFGILEKEIMDDGEYIIKGVYNNKGLKDFKGYKSYYKPLSLNINSIDLIDIKQEDDFGFTIKRIDLIFIKY